MYGDCPHTPRKPCTSVLDMSPICPDAPSADSRPSVAHELPTGSPHGSGIAPLPFEFSMAFQPIVDVSSAEVWAWEALVRGPKGEGAASVLSRINGNNRYPFDQHCRVRALELAHRLSLPSRLSVNFQPNAVYEPRACIRTTVETANRLGFPLEHLQLEISATDEVGTDGLLRHIVDEYRTLGLGIAIDDFGSGYAGLHLLTHFQPDVLKLDMALVRDIDRDRTRRLIVRTLVNLASDLPCTLVAVGIETFDEARCLADLGITLHQGYAYARPGFETLPQPDPHLIARVKAG